MVYFLAEIGLLYLTTYSSPKKNEKPDRKQDYKDISSSFESNL